MRAHAILQKFQNLNDLQKLRDVLRKSSSNDAPENDVFADFLADIYSSDAMELTWDVNLIQQISEFSFCELLYFVLIIRSHFGSRRDRQRS